ncbi:SPOR domain-containing protein [Thermodesulfobacteriota bacterium]
MRDKKSDMKYEFKLNFKELTLFIVGSIGVISLFFIVGIWIGKTLNAVPLDPTVEERLIPSDIPTEDVAEVDEEKEFDIATKEEDTEYKFPEAIDKGGIIPLTRKKETTPNNKSKNDSDAKKAKQKKENIDTFNAKKNTAKKASTKVAAKKPAGKKKSSSKKGIYSVQIASLKSDAAAVKLKAKLENKGLDAYFVATELKGKGIWYRVRVGSFGTKKDAKKMIAKLEKLVKMQGMVVKDNR